MKKWTCAAALLVAIAACDDAPTAPTAPLAREVPNVALPGVPGAGPMSTQGPVAGPLSSSSPQAGAMSTGFPQMEQGSGNAASIASAGTFPGWTSNARVFGPRRGVLAATVVAPAMRLLWQNTSTGDRSIWIMNGASWDGSSYALLPSAPLAWSMVATGDFNGDGNSDIVWQNTVTGDRSIWFMNNNTWGGSFALLPNVALAWSIAGAGDFNGDGYPDLVWQNTTTGDRSIWFMNGSTWGGSFALLPSVDPNWRIAAVADMNADNKPDLVWQNITTGQRAIWFMNGSTWSGSYALLPTVATSWSIAGAADFDGDNKPDLVWQNLTTGQRSIWMMNGSTWDGLYALLPTVSTAWNIAGTLLAPVAVPGKTRFKSLGLAGKFTCGVSTTGLGYCWGFDFSGTLGTGYPSKATDTCGVYVGAVPCTATPLRVSSEETFGAVATARYVHTCGLATSGIAFCWGSDGEGQLGIGGPGLSMFVPTPVLGDLNFSQLVAGSGFTCGLQKESGKAYCWGNNQYGSLGRPGGSSGTPVLVSGSLTFNFLAAGDWTACAITAAQVAYCWGWNGNFELGVNTDEYCGVVRCSSSPVAVSGDLRFTTVAVGSYHACGIATGGLAYCWGLNYLGQGGRADPATVVGPTSVAGGLKFTSLVAGSAHTCGLTLEGTAYCWGLNGVGQLGTPTTEECYWSATATYDCATAPIPVAGGHRFLVIAAGIEHTCGIDVDGRTYCWGLNETGQLGDGTYINRAVPTLVSGQ